MDSKKHIPEPEETGKDPEEMQTEQPAEKLSPKEQGKRNLSSFFVAILAVLVPAALTFLLVSVTKLILG